MILKISFLSLFLILPVFANELLKNECKKVSTLDQNECKSELYIEMMGPAKDLAVISKSMQEGMWLSDKMTKVIQENDKKKKFLESSENSFLIANAGYPNGPKDEHHLEKVELYQEQYEQLFQAARSESMIQSALNTCYGAAGFRCSLEKMDDLKIKHAAAQSKKLSILISYPLLSNESIRENIEDEIELYGEYSSGKLKGFNSFKEFQDQRFIQRRDGFSKLMLSGIKKTKKALAQRQEKWIDLKNTISKAALNQIEIENGNKKRSIGHAGRNQSLETANSRVLNNTEMITELLNGNTVLDELQDPLIGNAVCSIFEKNQNQIKIDERNQMILDGALLVAPFLLGPLGAAARLASLGRLANWGVKGRTIIAGGLEGGLIAKDLSDLSKVSDRCSGLTLTLLDGDEKGKIDKSATLKEIDTCQDELQNQILMAAAGASLAPMSLLYGTAAKSSKLSEASSSILKKFNHNKQEADLSRMLDSKGLQAEDLDEVKKQFYAFKKNSNLTGDEALKKFEKRFDEMYGATCEL